MPQGDNTIADERAAGGSPVRKGNTHGRHMIFSETAGGQRCGEASGGGSPQELLVSRVVVDVELPPLDTLHRPVVVSTLPSFLTAQAWGV